MFRVMLILGLLVLVPAAIVFWRMRDRTTVMPQSPSVSHKAIGTSTLNHGDPPAGKDVAPSPSQSERRP
ncbi:MAG: hypothetical protein ABL970_03205 [Nitrospira sp.]